MAEWRALGYVPDSDDEDDTQNSIQPDQPILKEDILSLHQVEKDGEAKNAEIWLDDLPENVSSKNHDKKIETLCRVGEREIDIKPPVASNTSNQPGRFVAIEIRKGTVSDTVRRFLEIKDIDELQQDHYRSLSAVGCNSTATVGEQHDIPWETISSPKLSTTIESFPSSPLTELLSSPTPPPFLTYDTNINLRNNNASIDTSTTNMHGSVELDSSINPDFILDLGTNGMQQYGNGASRNLRQRNPIQLHPYALESEKYRQVLKARGIKPLRIAQVREDFSQQADFQDEFSQAQFNDEVSPNLASSSPTYDHEEPVLPSAIDPDTSKIEEEFPDVGALLRSHPSGTAVGGAKRRKTAHEYSKKLTSTLTPRTKEPFEQLRASSLDVDESMFDDVPLSPPQSGDSPLEHSRYTRSGFRIPRGLSPATLPTPIASSELRRRSLITDVEVNNENAVESNFDSSEDGVQSLEISDSSSSENDTNRQLESVQRKIRGVLPASWLKIDLERQKQKKQRPEAGIRLPSSSSADITVEPRGVARRVNRPWNRTSKYPLNEDTPIIVSDDDDSDLSIQELIKPYATGNLQIFCEPENDLNYVQPTFIADQFEALEDNRVDEMLDTKKPWKSYSRNSRKLKTKTLSKQGQFTDLKLSNSDQVNPSKQPRITDRFSKIRRRKPVFRPPRLSVLDISTRDSFEVKPPFLKIASRTVRSRVDKGRHSPTHKYIRLATVDDTNDAYEPLRSWREGSSMPTLSLSQLSNKLSHRQSLHPISGNNQIALNPATFLEGFEKKQTSNLTLERPRGESRQNVYRKFQSSLDHFNEPRISNMVRREGSNSKNSIPAGQQRGALGRGHILTSLTSISDHRPATLETLKNVNVREKSQVVFQRRPSFGDQGIYQPATPNVPLQRFLKEVEPTSKTKAVYFNHETGQHLDRVSIAEYKPPVQRSKKQRNPRQIKIDAPSFRQKSPSIAVDILAETQGSATYQATSVITGLGPFGSRYTQNFNVKPLPAGIYLHPNTFVGSGAFCKSLKHETTENMEISRGFETFRCNEEVFRWGPWNDTVSDQIGKLFDAISEWLSSSSSRSGTTAYHQIVSRADIFNYFVNRLSFYDAVDRNLCLERCKELIIRLMKNVNDWLELLQDCDQDYKLQIFTLLLGLTHQLYRISQHELVRLDLKAQIFSLMIGIARQNISLALNEGFHSFPECLDNLGHLEACEYGIKEGIGSIEAVIVSHHILRENTNSLAAFWDIASATILGKEANTTTDVRMLDRSWGKLFTLLPFLEFDDQGIMKPGQRFAFSNDNWPLVKVLVGRVLDAYIQNPDGQGPTFNAYCRALLGRCLHLIRSWGWYGSQLIIGTLFDFFARNSLAHLKNEDSHGSPRFLEHLGEDPQLEASPEDRSFHLFLKILGTSLSQMRRICSEKKIRDMVWRLMPNHGRLYPKEDVIHQKDLDALRNHHDLLCTLYWASPSAARPRLSVIRNLVHLESSHREACHINIRAWSNLVRYQLVADEDISSLEPFAVWHDDLVNQLIRQFKYARSEAEEHVRSVESTGIHISQNILEANIARNQRQVAASLSDALTSLKVNIDATRNIKQANAFITPTLVAVFELFNAHQPQAHNNIIQALDVIQGYARLSDPVQTQHGNGSANDDSQDYGDWSAFEDMDIIAAHDQSHHIPDSALLEQHAIIYKPLKRLLSNCFGADNSPEDPLLSKVIQTWVIFAHVLVHQGTRSWDDYVTQFGQDSWSSLRQTKQTRKFTNYYLALLLESEQDIFEEHQTFFLASWVESLVERESLLKFQHRLTTAILNLGSSNAILQTLPFWSKNAKNWFEITGIEFSERRLSLISCILSNMRESIKSVSQRGSPDSLNLKQEYAGILKIFMAAMKRNYQELGHDLTSQSAYVGFVHRVVEFLQQHTADIYPVDRFFIDSAAFPLPTNDPTYVVGRLKNYGLRLQDSRTPKQLSVFLQLVSERAVYDRQQDYLAGQLYAAMSNVFEDGDMERPTLQSFLVKGILPSYIQISFSTSSGWLLALPFLIALKPVFLGMLTCLDGASSSSRDGVLSIVTAFLYTTRISLEILDYHSGPLEQVNILEILSKTYSAITALLPILDYILRLSAPMQLAIQCIDFFKAFAIYASRILQEDQGVPFPEFETDVVGVPYENIYAEIQAFTLRELQDSLSKNWAFRDGRYYLTKGGNAPREVNVNGALSSSYGEAKRILLSAIVDFFHCLEAMPFLGGEGNVYRPSTTRRSGVEDLVI